MFAVDVSGIDSSLERGSNGGQINYSGFSPKFASNVNTSAASKQLEVPSNQYVERYKVPSKVSSTNNSGFKKGKNISTPEKRIPRVSIHDAESPLTVNKKQSSSAFTSGKSNKVK
jgi:hypothetical protein